MPRHGGYGRVTSPWGGGLFVFLEKQANSSQGGPSKQAREGRSGNYGVRRASNLERESDVLGELVRKVISLKVVCLWYRCVALGFVPF